MAAIASLGVAAITGLTIVTYASTSTSSKILTRQNRLIADVLEVSMLVSDLQTKNEADRQYKRLDRKINQKYGELKEHTLGIDKRVRELEMNR